MKAALLQLNSSDDPAENLTNLLPMIRDAVTKGAGFVLTPEVTNCVSSSRKHQQDVLSSEDQDPFLAALRKEAKALDIWLLIGSLGIKTDDPDGRFANRSFLIGPDGEIAARYDKIHMFDVEINEAERFRESDGYRPGDRGVIAQTPFGTLGLSICYDVRFPHLYRAMAQAGADIMCVPAAFSPTTGAAHWETLLRARAIETGSYVLAPAQTGQHKTSRGKPRATYGHSVAIAPWGEVIARAGDKVETLFVDLDPSQVHNARYRVPSLTHDRLFQCPE